MPFTLINQPTTWHTAFVNLLVKLMTQVLAPPLQPSPDPYPHDPRKFMPKNFEQNLNVSVERFQFKPNPDWVVFPNQEHWIPVVIKPNQSTKPKRFLLYWHGSAFVSMINPGHWIMLGKLAHELDAEIAVQTYVMAPHAGVHQNIDPILSIYHLLRNTAKENGQEFLIGGDSAGGNIAAAVTLALHDRNAAFPDQIIMISPGMDIHLDQPANRAIQKNDPMLLIDRISAATFAWANGPTKLENLYKPAPTPTPEQLKNLQHPYASPVYGNWEFMKEAKVPITLIMGTYDILLPQVDQFAEMCKQLDIEMTYIRAEGCCHVYPILAGFPGASFLAPESVEGLKLMVDSVKRYSNM